MKTVKTTLSPDLKEIELHLFADEHIGDACCDIPRLKERIDYVASTPNAYCILNGDILDYASRSSIGDIETRELNIMAQLERAIELFSPIKDKILCITNGNHENRAYKKEGIDISKMIAMQLGLVDVYAPASVMLFLRFGDLGPHHHNRRQLYTIYCVHGSGGGRKEGSKVVRLADLASIIDADCYIMSHTHLPVVMKQGFFRTDTSNSTVHNVTKLFVNTASNLDYGGYGEAQSFKPNSKDTPIILLSGQKRDMSVRF